MAAAVPPLLYSVPFSSRTVMSVSDGAWCSPEGTSLAPMLAPRWTPRTLPAAPHPMVPVELRVLLRPHQPGGLSPSFRVLSDLPIDKAEGGFLGTVVVGWGGVLGPVSWCEGRAE